MLAVLLVRWLSEPISGFTQIVLVWLGCALVASVIGELVAGSHKVVRRWATVRSSSRLVWMIVIKEIVLAVVLLTGLVRLPSTALSVLAMMADGLFTGLALFYIRFAARVFSKSEVKRVKQEASRKNALISGTDEAAVALAREIIAGREYNVVGYITNDSVMSGRVIGDIIVYYCAGTDDMERLEWRLGGVDCVFLPKRVITGRGGKGDSSVASLPQNDKGVSPRDDTVYSDGMSRFEMFVKRSFDVVLSGALMAVFSPLALLSAIAVKLEDGGPILYKQERIGRNGKPFYILKFRSMRTDAEAAGARLYSGDSDPRLTRVGAFLRQHHLDELPQLWNVFKGDMSFIGYRPERQCYIEQIEAENPRYSYLYQIRPGVTSYATLYNGYTDTLEKMLTRLDLDLYYLRNHSLGFDMRVLGMTFLSIISGKKF